MYIHLSLYPMGLPRSKFSRAPQRSARQFLSVAPHPFPSAICHGGKFPAPLAAMGGLDAAAMVKIGEHSVEDLVAELDVSLGIERIECRYPFACQFNSSR